MYWLALLENVNDMATLFKAEQIPKLFIFPEITVFLFKTFAYSYTCYMIAKKRALIPRLSFVLVFTLGQQKYCSVLFWKQSRKTF